LKARQRFALEGFGEGTVSAPSFEVMPENKGRVVRNAKDGCQWQSNQHAEKRGPDEPITIHSSTCNMMPKDNSL
jgi:hypothetical protein